LVTHEQFSTFATSDHHARQSGFASASDEGRSHPESRVR
jgi:hypothetical protein